MKKFSKINESIKIDKDKIELSLGKLTDFKYQIYDYFSTKDVGYMRFNSDIKDIKAGSRYSSVILITPPFEYVSAEIPDYHDILKFNSSGFYFYDDIIKTKEIFDKIFILVEELKDYSPKMCIKDHKILIYLLGEEVTEYDLKVNSEMTNAYNKLYNKLNEYSKDHKHILKGVTKMGQTLFITPLGGDKRISKTLASLCTQMASKSAYSWIRDEKIDEDLEDIKDVINDLGFCIEFKGTYENNYRLILVEL